MLRYLKGYIYNPQAMFSLVDLLLNGMTITNGEKHEITKSSSAVISTLYSWELCEARALTKIIFGT